MEQQSGMGGLVEVLRAAGPSFSPSPNYSTTTSPGRLFYGATSENRSRSPRGIITARPTICATTTRTTYGTGMYLVLIILWFTILHCLHSPWGWSTPVFHSVCHQAESLWHLIYKKCKLPHWSSDGCIRLVITRSQIGIPVRVKKCY